MDDFLWTLIVVAFLATTYFGVRGIVRKLKILRSLDTEGVGERYDLSLPEFGALSDVWTATRKGAPQPFAGTASQQRLVSLGLIKVVRASGNLPIDSIPPAARGITLQFAEITPRGREVLKELMRQDGMADDALDEWFEIPGDHDS